MALTIGHVMPKYTKKEKEFIAKWAEEVDFENDRNRVVYSPSSKKRVTTLDMARARKRAKERAHKFKNNVG